jgi:hypothetical protein
MFDASTGRALLPCDNRYRFQNEYFLELGYFKVEIGSVGSKEAYSAELKKYIYLS